jgi:hypothetical protein
MGNFIDMMHAIFGLLFIISSFWMFVEVLNVTDFNIARIKSLSWITAILMWVAYLIGGYCYVVLYAPEKALIIKGPWPFAHNFFMETKEHVIFIMVLLATFLPILASNDFLRNKDVRSLMLWVTGLMAVMGLSIAVAGNIIIMGAKVALMPN